MSELGINIAAAKMLELPTEVFDTIDGEVVVTGAREFDLFTNPSDLVAVVKYLGEKHKLFLVNLCGTWQVITCKGSRNARTPYISAHGTDYYNTYEEAVGAAVEAIESIDI